MVYDVQDLRIMIEAICR